MSQNIIDRFESAEEQLQGEYPELHDELSTIQYESAEDFGSVGVGPDKTFYFDPKFMEDVEDIDAYVSMLAQTALRFKMGLLDEIPELNREWNLSQDLVINYILAHKLGMQFEERAIMPDEDGVYEVTVSSQDHLDHEYPEEISGLDEKTVEEVYEDFTGEELEVVEARTTRHDLDI